MNFAIFSIIFIVTDIACLAFAIFMMKRNDRNYSFRTKVLRESKWDAELERHEPYDSLPSYNVMLNKFWIPFKLERWIKK